jgi:hypothetical protein
MIIETKIESERGCGYRKAGGLYLIGGKFGHPCAKLPIPLTVCPCCKAGIKFSRGFQWIGSALVEEHPCANEAEECRKCSVWDSSKLDKYGLMWVGEKYYPTPDHFRMEGHRQGISKRIAAVPKDFTVGVDWILLAHRKAIPSPDPSKATQGIFQAFKPTRIEFVVKGDESEAELEAIVKRGITPVRVVKDVDAQSSIPLIQSQN